MTEPYSIQDLSEKTGLPRRTIHFYTQQGLLPPPQGSGLGARYDESHLLRLQLIPVFRAEGLRLDQIRERFQEMALSELEDHFKHAKAVQPIPATPNTPHPERFSHYSFPGGITILVPEELSQAQHEKISQLLIEAERIFNTRK